MGVQCVGGVEYLGLRKVVLKAPPLLVVSDIVLMLLLPLSNRFSNFQGIQNNHCRDTEIIFLE